MRQILIPKNEILNKYVRYISFHKSEPGKRQFLVFPNPGSAIGLQRKHGFIKEGNNVYRGTGVIQNDVELLHVNRIDPVKVIDEGINEVITIVFHPLGINQFIKEDLSDIIKTNDGDRSFIPLEKYSFSGFAALVFKKKLNHQRLAVIENFLLNKMRNVKIPFVSEAINALTNMDESPLYQ